MGKREIGELSILDLVVFIMIAEMAVMAIEQPKDPIIHTLLPMGVIVTIQIVFAWISLRSKPFRELLDGTPSVIIHGATISAGPECISLAVAFQQNNIQFVIHGCGIAHNQKMIVCRLNNMDSPVRPVTSIAFHKGYLLLSETGHCGEYSN